VGRPVSSSELLGRGCTIYSARTKGIGSWLAPDHDGVTRVLTDPAIASTIAQQSQIPPNKAVGDTNMQCVAYHSPGTPLRIPIARSRWHEWSVDAADGQELQNVPGRVARFMRPSSRVADWPIEDVATGRRLG
jgi:hypothetical protein